MSKSTSVDKVEKKKLKKSSADKEKKEKDVEKSQKKAEKTKKVKKSEDGSKEVEKEDVSASYTADNSEPATNRPAENTLKRKKPATLEEKVAEQETDPNLLEVDVEAPTPLSKAQARAAKKEAKRSKKEGRSTGDASSERKESEGEKATEDDAVAAESARPKKKAKSNDSKPKRAHSVWIGNLSFKTTPTALKEWFTKQLQGEGAAGTPAGETEPTEEAGSSSTGPAPIVTRVNLPMKQGRAPVMESRGFAYVDFASPLLQRRALRLSEKLLEGRKVLIKLGDDYAPTPDARTPKPPSVKAGSIPKSQLHAESTSLFVGNLDFTTTEEELFAHVEANHEAAMAPSARGKDGRYYKKPKDDNKSDAESNESSSEDDSDSNDEESDASDDENAAEKLEASSNDVKDGSSNVELIADGTPKPRGKVSADPKFSGLKKVRMPTFEDSGKCKGFAFLDFVTKDQARFALANRANHYLRGRKLRVQYASNEATQRSMSALRRSQLKKVAEGDDSSGKPDVDAAGVAKTVLDDQRSKDTRGKKWEAKGRPRPGAALAAAKRQTTAIVDSGEKGKKITFD